MRFKIAALFSSCHENINKLLRNKGIDSLIIMAFQEAFSAPPKELSMPLHDPHPSKR